MAKLIDAPFALQEGDNGAVQNSRETLRNMFAEIVQSGEAQIIRRSRPGLVSARALTGEKRCIERHGSTHYLIVGNTLYSYAAGTLTTLDTLDTGTGRCSMIFNDNDQIMISDGSFLYYWNGTALNLVTLPVGVTPGHLAYLSGYGIVVSAGTGVFYITAANDFSAIDALDFATAESSPDPLVTCFVDHNELWLAGERTTEVWQLTGGTDFPFSPLSNAQLERGCGAEFSYAAEDNTVFFLGDDDIVYRADGYRPAKVSSLAIDDAIALVSDEAKETAYATIFTWRGHKFYTLTFPGELTVQYNISTGLWNRADSFGYDYWRMMGSAGHHSDYYLTNTAICTLGRVNTDEDVRIRRGGVSAPGNANGQRITIHELRVDVEVGRVAADGQALLMMRVARDGETFGNVRSISLGDTGNYRKQIVFRGLGQGRKPVVELFCTDNVELTIMGTKVRATVDAV